MLPGVARHACGCFAQQRLPVYPPLAGEHELCTLQGSVELGELGNELHARAKSGVEKGLDHKPQAACSTGTRGIDLVAPRFGCTDLCEMSKRPIEMRHIVGRGTLLRTEDRGCASFAAQRIINVNRDLELNLRQTRIEITQVDARK